MNYIPAHREIVALVVYHYLQCLLRLIEDVQVELLQPFGIESLHRRLENAGFNLCGA